MSARTTHCTFPSCDCNLENNGRPECRRRRVYRFEAGDRGFAIIDHEGNAVALLHSEAVAQQVVDDLNRRAMA